VFINYGQTSAYSKLQVEVSFDWTEVLTFFLKLIQLVIHLSVMAQLWYLFVSGVWLKNWRGYILQVSMGCPRHQGERNEVGVSQPQLLSPSPTG